MEVAIQRVLPELLHRVSMRLPIGWPEHPYSHQMDLDWKPVWVVLHRRLAEPEEEPPQMDLLQQVVPVVHPPKVGEPHSWLPLPMDRLEHR